MENCNVGIPGGRVVTAFVVPHDLWNAYHLFWICQGDEWKTAFNNPLWHFGEAIRSNPAVFQSLVNDVLCDMLYKFIFVYIDDPHIFVIHI